MVLVKVNATEDVERAVQNLTDIAYVKAFRSINFETLMEVDLEPGV